MEFFPKAMLDHPYLEYGGCSLLILALVSTIIYVAIRPPGYSLVVPMSKICSGDTGNTQVCEPNDDPDLDVYLPPKNCPLHPKDQCSGGCQWSDGTCKPNNTMVLHERQMRTYYIVKEVCGVLSELFITRSGSCLPRVYTWAPYGHLKHWLIAVIFVPLVIWLIVFCYVSILGFIGNFGCQWTLNYRAAEAAGCNRYWYNSQVCCSTGRKPYG